MLKSLVLISLATACLAIPLAEELPPVPSDVAVPSSDIEAPSSDIAVPPADFAVPPPPPPTAGFENRPPSPNEPASLPAGQKPQDSDLKTDSTFWWGYRRPYYRSYYRPRYYYSYYTPYYHDHYYDSSYWW